MFTLGFASKIVYMRWPWGEFWDTMCFLWKSMYFASLHVDSFIISQFWQYINLHRLHWSGSAPGMSPKINTFSKCLITDSSAPWHIVWAQRQEHSVLYRLFKEIDQLSHRSEWKNQSSLFASFCFPWLCCVRYVISYV
jgi:hypothetical protein